MSEAMRGVELTDETVRDAGAAALAAEHARHYKRPRQRPFTPEDRKRVTILYGGLTQRHDRLIGASVRGIGYNVEPLPTPTKADYQTGREYGNNGMCNPTYFTAGALINYLKRLRDEQGMSVDEIVDKYAFATAGSRGPCRFGVYSAEYRNALRNSGFEGFRAMAFQQTGGLDQTGDDGGLEMTTMFGLALINAIALADLLNEVTYHIRPYEAVPGQTDRVMGEAARRVAETLESRRYDALVGRPWVRALGTALPGVDPYKLALLFEQYRSDAFVSALCECAALIDETVEVDYLRPKPTCKIIGEFWAQTTEGDGNFNMFPFIESQGGEVLVEPITTWIAYVIAHARDRLIDERGIPSNDVAAKKRTAWNVLREHVVYGVRRVQLWAVGSLLLREYERYRQALGGTAHAQVDQAELRDLARRYYHPRCAGGEGHLEVAKTMYYTRNGLAHMVLSLKPFNCMPSTQSDGAQAAVTAHHPSILYVPIETSGEGDLSAYSRVQMALGEAKVQAREEFRECVARTGRTLDELRRYCAEHRELRRPLQQIRRHPGVIGRAANFALYVGALMDREQV